MRDLLSGRTALITGTAGGIGGAVASVFVEQGARVVGVDRAAGGPADVIEFDLAETAGLRGVVDEATARLGRIDILVNVAGMFVPEAVTEISAPAYEKTMRVNLHAPVFLMSAASTQMIANKYGRIVNITSIHSRLSEPLSLAYDVSKGGLEAATRTFALELAASNVLVNAVAPGFVNTNMSIVDGVSELESEWFRTVYIEYDKLPVQRAAEPDEIAAHVAFLCSDQNTYCTGQSLIVDGGLTARF